MTDEATATREPLSREELRRLDAYWRAANYLSVGQIYLLDNPLLREPLGIEHVKPRLLGHWGTTPGLNFIYAHMNRVIREQDLNALYVAGPGHGGPGIVANVYLEGRAEIAEIQRRARRDGDPAHPRPRPRWRPRAGGGEWIQTALADDRAAHPEASASPRACWARSWP
ncbi:MAG TPA: hypothetical protein VIJ66_04825 [Solirubrobacteraceae bacterium]